MVQFASTTLPQQPGGDYNAQNISRQRKMADMLAQQGAEVLPAGQMVGNRFVPTPWTQGLAKALQSITGAYLSKQADTKEQAKSQKLSEVLTDPNLWRDRIEGGAILGQTNQPAPGDITMPPPQAAPESLASGPQAMTPIGAPVPVGDPAGGAGGITMPEITAPKVEVVGKTAPKMMTTAALIQALAQKHQETGVPMADLMQAFAPRIAQLSAMEKPTVLNQGDQMVNPLTGDVLAQGAPKPVAEPKQREFKTEWVQKSGPDGQPLYDKNNDPVMELRTFDPVTGAMGETALGIKPGNTGTRVTTTATATASNKANEKGFEKVADKQAEQVAATAGRARTAQQGIMNTVDPMLRVLDSGKFVMGPTADQRVWMRQLGDTMGITGKSNEEILANTRTLIQGMAGQELDSAARLAGQGQISNAEREIIAQAASGKLATMTPPELRQLLLATRKVHLLTIGQHRSNVDVLKKTPGAPTILPEWDINSPGEYVPERRATDKPKGKPAAPKIQPGTVADGYRFKGGNPNDPNSWERVK